MRTLNTESLAALNTLHSALHKGRGTKYCLQLWSRFIRLRDNNRCVLCHSKTRLSAHHIVRKSFWSHVRYQTGNGITLCHDCHKEPHQAFNGKPNLELPMDAEGGENIDLLTGLLGALIVDAKNRKAFHDEFYSFDASALRAFKKIQGVSEQARFPGYSLEQAYLIWNQTPRGMLEAMLRSVGVVIPDDYVQTEKITFFESQTLSYANGAAGSVLYMRYIPPTPFKSDNPDFWTEE